MNIGVIGVNHLCPIDLREKISFTHTKKIEALHTLKAKHIDEVIVLSTCNRSEIYIWDRDLENKMQEAKAFYESFFQCAEIETYLIYKTGLEAVSHLYHVAAGLDSIVIGEDQILGQVKEAWGLAVNEQTSGKMLNKIFREAVSTSTAIKHTIKISENPLSISSVAVKFLKEKMQGLEHKRILMIGIGKMSKLVIKYLEEEKVDRIYASNRSHQRAVEIGTIYPNIVPIDYKDRYTVLGEVDAVVCATSSPHVVMQAKDMPAVTKPLFMVDIALPRDIDPKIGHMPYTKVYDIDDLKTICEESNQKRILLSQEAKKIIVQKVEEIEEWIKLAQVDRTLQLLNEKKNEIQKNTLESIYKKTDLSFKDKEVIDKVIESALKNLLKTPAVNIKKIKDKSQRENYIKVLEELFEL
ncbi:MAG: glutamyl-tRNA reductase [Clostridia bacterium]|nr:glutamyl-tRNA reductase [Clostridia bacterium]